MRYFLLDAVTELVPGERAAGLKCVTLTDEVLHDHFPDHPILPGALIVEAAAQLGGLLVESTLNPPPKELGDDLPRRAVLAMIEKVKLHDAAGPGDRLTIQVEFKGEIAGSAKVSFQVSADERKIARGALTFVLREVASLRVHEQRRQLYQIWMRNLADAPEVS
jgi:3-hydroxyacyl-[acyl-carrier-protein] dehydratase